MAAMFITKNVVLFNLSKALPQTPSLSLRTSYKVSSVCFSSSSNYNCNEGRDLVEKAGDSRADMAYKSRETMNDTDEDISNLTGKVKERAREMKEKAKEYGHETKEKAKEGTYKAADMAEGAKERAKETKEKAQAGTERAAEEAHETKGKAKDYTHSVKEKTARAADAVADKTAETAQSLGKKAKQTVKGAWETAKDTTQKVKEKVVGKDDDEDYIEDHRETRMDEDAVELRRQAGEQARKDKNNY